MPGPDDEILDRPYQVRAPGARVYDDSAVSDLFDDEILDRPWYAGCYCPYTICVHPPMPVPRSAGEEMRDRPQADILGMGSNSGDPMIDVMLLAGAPLLGDAARSAL